MPLRDAGPLLAAVAFDADGLVPVIAQEARTGMVRMLAWANRDALAATLATGAAHFWSRSRQASWRKGETSGNTLAVREVRIDCDGDVVLYVCDPAGPSCHTGATSCFYRRVGETDDGALVADDGPADPPALVHRARRRGDREAPARAAGEVVRGVAAGRGGAEDQRQDRRGIGRADRGAGGERRRRTSRTRPPT